jgi:hypothetical protein
MSKPGTKSPRTLFPKDADGDTKLPYAEGAKCVKEEKLDFVRGEVSDIGDAPTSRVYTRDYSKGQRSPGDTDLITDALGRNPFRI